MQDPKRSVEFRYELGHTWFKTSTVAELIAFLQQYPADMPVVATWEGTVHGFSGPKVEELQGKECLFLDVEYDLPTSGH